MLILASASPRRLELLERLTREFRVVPADVDETLAGGPTPEAVAALALRKARTVAVRLEQGVVLGADTVVVIDGDVLGKPADAAEARTMLYRLRGRRHEVITGLAVVDAAGGRSATEAVVTGVVMRGYDDATIDAYVASGEPLDKAGAYAIQATGGALVAGWLGSYSNVVGLPLDATRRLLAGFGVVSAPVSRSRA
ncbi:MAG TPA: Maf family protein [Methylomirabilota bacterium]|nr:Maf family protein [Methylomirabilota bacterium]